jgi:hypothetical protein
MTTPIESLLAATYDGLGEALARTCRDGAPVVRSQATDRAIEALAGYAIGVFLSHVSSRLALGVDLSRGTAIRVALQRESARVSPSMARAGVDAIMDDERVVTGLGLRTRVASRLRASRADCSRILTAIVEASGGEPAWLARVLGELARGDLVAFRFAERVEEVWAQLHGERHGRRAAFDPPPSAKPEYYVVEIR